MFAERFAHKSSLPIQRSLNVCCGIHSNTEQDVRFINPFRHATGASLFLNHSGRILSDDNIKSLMAKTRRKLYPVPMDEGRKRVLAIVAGILVARHLKTTEDLNDCHPSPRTEYLIAAAVQWAERIMQKIDDVFGKRFLVRLR